MTAVALLICIAALFLGLTLWGDTARQAVLDSLELCRAVLIPSLFPFSVGIHLMLNLGFARNTGTGKKNKCKIKSLFRNMTPLWVGLIGGFPLGAICLAGMYEQGELSRKNAIRISAVCSQAGPAFLLGAVGGTILNSKQAGLLLFAIHLVSALLCALLFCTDLEPERFPGAEKHATPSVTDALLRSIEQSAMNMVRITGTVVFFSVLAKLFLRLLPGQWFSGRAGGFLTGVLELSSGAASFVGCSPASVLPQLSFLCAWGGFCVHVQAAQALRRAGLPMKRYYLGKLTQAGIAWILSWSLIPVIRSGSVRRLWTAVLTASVCVLLPVFCGKRENRSGKKRNLCYNNDVNESDFGRDCYAVPQKNRRKLRLLRPRRAGIRGGIALQKEGVCQSGGSVQTFSLRSAQADADPASGKGLHAV